MSEKKIAKTNFPVADFIKNRWSARSFSEQKISEETMNTLIEAATWAFSANNEQPWRYVVAHKGSTLFDEFHNALMGGNKPWCKNAAALVLSAGKKTYSSNGQDNQAMLHDVGAANMLLTLQANELGIYTHVLGGYDANQVAELLNLKDDIIPVYMIAMGYLDVPEKLEEPFKTREISERSRKTLEEILININR